MRLPLLSKPFVWVFLGCVVTTINAFSQTTAFVENKNQFHKNILFRADLGGITNYLEHDGFTLKMKDEEAHSEVMHHLHTREPLDDTIVVKHHALRFKFINPNPSIYISGEVKAPYTHHYFLGNDKSKWASEVSLFQRVHYREVFPNIDVKFYSSESQFKYDWVVHPGGVVSDIGVEIRGHEGFQLVGEKLHIKTSLGNVIEAIPEAYQIINNEKILVQCRFKINGDKIGYEADNYNQQYPLVIDPVVIFSTYSGSRADNFGFTATYDQDGNLYAGGITDGDTSDYPVTSGAFDKTYNGGQPTAPANLRCDITLSKYNPDGTQLLYATYVGGSQSEYPHSLVVNNSGELIILGTSYSNNFPTSNRAYERGKKGDNTTTDIVLFKMSSNGSQLLGSTFIGGAGNDGLNTSSLKYNYADDFRGDVVVDKFDNIFVATTTLSDDIPIVNGFQNKSGGFQDGCVFQFDTKLEKLLWSTYVGGAGVDALYSIKIGDDEKIYVGGGSTSTSIYSDTSVFQPKKGGDQDGIILRIDYKTLQREHFTYFGKGNYDQIYFLEIDSDGNIYATGQTKSLLNKTNPSLYGESGKGQFVFKCDTAFKSIEWLTTFGVKNQDTDISPTAFLVDQCDHIYISGWGSDIGFQVSGSTTGLEITPDAIQKTTDGSDFYVLVLDKNATSILHGTYFGGSLTGDHVDGGTSRFDKKGVIYQSVCSSCPGERSPAREVSDFPTTADAVFPLNVSPRCSNASFKIDFQISNAVVAEFEAPIKLCLGSEVQFKNQSTTYQTWKWDFGDGNSDTTNFSPTHVYDQPGVYEVKLKAINPLACNLEDETTRIVEIIQQAEADFEYGLNPCLDIVDFTNLSGGVETLRWDFGDGTESEQENPSHRYPNSGEYRIVLHVNEFTVCPDSTIAFLSIDTSDFEVLELYNAFTPNGDGINDCFGFPGLIGDCITIEWKVYNRWGELVHHAERGDECWDGKNELGTLSYPEGTYFYILKLENNVSGNIETVSGTVSLLDKER